MLEGFCFRHVAAMPQKGLMGAQLPSPNQPAHKQLRKAPRDLRTLEEQFFQSLVPVDEESEDLASINASPP